MMKKLKCGNGFTVPVMDSTVTSNVLQALDDFPLTLEEYLEHRQEITLRAIEHYRQRYGLQDNTPDGVIDNILKAKCRALLAGKTHWITVPMDKASPISCLIKGTRFEGRAHIDPKSIRISLNEGPSKECILLDLAPCIFTEEPFIGSPANEYGQKCAKDLFLDICGETLMHNKEKSSP